MNKKTLQLIGFRLRKYGYKNLREYYQSERWKEKRDEFRRKNKDVCCVACFKVSYKLDVHHKSYKSLCDEKLDQLCYLCRKCHKKVHDLVEKQDVSIRIATKKIQRRNHFKRNKNGHDKISQLRTMDSKYMKGIAKTRHALSAHDENIYDPQPMKVISPDGKVKIVHFQKREKPKPKQKKFYIPPVTPPSRKKKKVKVKYTNEEIAKIIYAK